MSTTFETAALWSATSLATDPNKIGAAGLSVRQRKLLTLLSQPMSASQLATSIALPIDEVHAALDRFAKLGLVHSGEAATLDPMKLRSTANVNANSNANAAASESPSRMPMMIGMAIAALALVAAAAWMSRKGSSSDVPAPTQVATNATSSVAKPPTLTGSADTADIVLPKTAAIAPAAAAASVAPAAAPVVASPAAAAAAASPPTTAAARAAAAAALASAKSAKSDGATDATAPAIAPVPVATPAATSAPPSAAATVSAPVSAVPTAAPASTAPAPAPVATTPVTVAAAAPTAATTVPRAAPAPAREIKLITRVEPLFPRVADNDKGTVRARLQVDARGSVTAVEILESNPPRVFDRSVRTALQQWRYEPTGEAFTTLAEISFSR